MIAPKESDGLLGRLGEEDESLWRQCAALVATRGRGSTEDGVEEEDKDIFSYGARCRFLLLPQAMVLRKAGVASR